MVRNLGELGVDMQKIMSRLLANQDLLKLLYYTDKDPLSGADLTKTQIDKEIFEKLVKIVPRVGQKETAKSIIAIRVLSGRTNSSNGEFRNISFGINVFVPLTQWVIKDSNLRPFKIMGEILKSLNNKKINGLGQIRGGDFALDFLTDEIACYNMDFNIIEYE